MQNSACSTCDTAQSCSERHNSTAVWCACLFGLGNLDGVAFQIPVVISAFTSHPWHPNVQAGKLPGLSVWCLLCSGAHTSPLAKQIFLPGAKALGSPPTQQSLPQVHGHSNAVCVHRVHGMDCIISKPGAGISVKHGLMISQAARELMLWYRQARRRGRRALL